MAIPKPAPSLTLDFDEAVEYFRRHKAVTREEWERLDAAARKRAVRVASIAHRGVLNDVWQDLEKAVAKGTEFRTFKEQIAEKLRKKYGAEGGVPAHLETIYLNETHRAFTHGRVIAALDPDVRHSRPFWQFKALEDNRITPICKECSDTIAEAGGPWWQQHMPPLHHRCRSSFVTLTPSQAGQRGGVTNTPPRSTGSSGFGRMPDVDDDGARLEAEKSAQLPRELQPKVTPPTLAGPPGHPRRQPDPPRTPGDPVGEPAGEEIGEPILPPRQAAPAPPPVPPSPPAAAPPPAAAAPPKPPRAKLPAYPPVDSSWPAIPVHTDPPGPIWRSQVRQVDAGLDALLPRIFGKSVPSPNALAKVYSTPDYEVGWSTATVYGDKLTLSGHLRDASGAAVARIERSFSRVRGRLLVDHDFLRFADPKKQGGGAGAEMARQAIRAYLQLGVSSVEVHAAWIGRYTWSSFGYEWRVADGLIMQPLMERFFVGAGIDAAKAQRLAAKYAKKGGNVVLSQLKIGKRQIGKEFLLDDRTPMWWGDLTLKPSNRGFKRAVERLGIYG